MAAVEQLITDNLDIWSSAVKAKSSAGRGAGKKIELYGIKKLRELILELAVRGLLVHQDPNDEPAAELLNKIAGEKEKLLADGIIRIKKTTLQVEEDEKPFQIPECWEWTRLNSIGHDLGQLAPETDFTYIDVGSINKELGVVSSPSVLAGNEAPSRARKIVKKGTVIYSTVRPYLLNIAVVDQDFDPMPIASTAFAIIYPYEGVLASFIYRYLRSPTFVCYVESCQTGIAYPAINDKQFFSGLFPLPPLAEQHRIVAKVDELMALCDQLEQQQESSIGAHQTLVQTLLGALTNGCDREGFAAAWARIAEHFDTLFTTEWSIEQLKQTILQLAVMGKLVPQNPNDEPASKLLKNIAAEKAKLIKEGKIKKQKPLPPISEEEKPFELPEGWEWVRIGQIAILKGGFAYKSKEFTNNSDFQVVRMGNIRPNTLRIDENPVFISQEYAESTPDYEILEKDILLTMTGTKGKRDYLYSLLVDNVDFGERKLYLNQRLCIVRPVVVSGCYINMVLKDDRMLDSIYAKSTGTANQANIGMDAILNWIIPLPAIEEQFCIVHKIDALFEICELLKNKISIAECAQLKLADAISDFSVR